MSTFHWSRPHFSSLSLSLRLSASLVLIQTNTAQIDEVQKGPFIPQRHPAWLDSYQDANNTDFFFLQGVRWTTLNMTSGGHWTPRKGHYSYSPTKSSAYVCHIQVHTEYSCCRWRCIFYLYIQIHNLRGKLLTMFYLSCMRVSMWLCWDYTGYTPGQLSLW